MSGLLRSVRLRPLSHCVALRPMVIQPRFSSTAAQKEKEAAKQKAREPSQRIESEWLKWRKIRDRKIRLRDEAAAAAADMAEAEATARVRTMVNERMELLMEEVMRQDAKMLVEADKETEMLDLKPSNLLLLATKASNWLRETNDRFTSIRRARGRDKDFSDATESQYHALRTEFVVKWHTMYYGLMGFAHVPYHQDREILRPSDLDITLILSQGDVSMSCYQDILDSSRIRWTKMISDNQTDPNSHRQWREMISPPGDHIILTVSRSLLHRISRPFNPTNIYVRHRILFEPTEDNSMIVLHSTILSATTFRPLVYATEYCYFQDPKTSYKYPIRRKEWQPLCEIMHKLWQDQAKVAQSHQVLVDSTFNIALEELVAKIPTPDPESTAMTSDELQNLFDSGITGVNDRSRSFGQPPTSVLNKMRENMAEEHSSNEQPDEEFLEDLRDDIAKWEIKDGVDESGEIPSDADITSQAGKPNDAMSSPKNNVPINAKKGSRRKR